MTPEEIELTPRRRTDDFVSYRDMVEYVAKTETEWHTMRAESLIQINNQIEHLENSFLKAVETIGERFEKHETWHRDVLQGFLDRAVQNKLSSGALIASIISIILSTSIALYAIIHTAH